MNFKTIEVNKDEIKAGDTIVKNGELNTVCNSNIKYNDFFGITIFGDSYKMGTEKVIKAII